MDCDCRSLALHGVCYGTVSDASGLGMRSRILSCDITTSGLNGIGPAPRKLLQMLSSAEALERLTRMRQGSPSWRHVWWTIAADLRSRYHMRASQPTSSGWSRCDECSGMQRVTIFSLVQRSWNSNRLGALVAVNTGKADVFRSSGSSYVD